MEGRKIDRGVERKGDSSDCKKGGGEGGGRLQEVSLTPTLFKLYISVLADRLREEVEEKRLFPQNQTGFVGKP